MCDKSGHAKFPFSYLEHLMLLTLAQAWLRPCPGFAQAGSPLLTYWAGYGAVCKITSTPAEEAQNWFHI